METSLGKLQRQLDNINKKYINTKDKLDKTKYEKELIEKQYNYLLKNNERKIEKEVKRVTEEFNKKVVEYENIVTNLYEEIDRLKEELQKKEENSLFQIDKLENLVNKDSTNSSMPSSTDFVTPNKKKKTSANEYNGRIKTRKQTGAQPNHEGHNLNKDYVEQIIKNKNTKIVEITHYIAGDKKEEDIKKYKLGLAIQPYVEVHIFKHRKNSNEILPEEFHTDVTYTNDLKALCIELGIYNVISMSRLADLISVLTNNIINLSEGFIYNVYSEFSKKCQSTLKNIENNILNEKYMHTDETSTKLNGKNIHFRGYGNDDNVLYRAHKNKIIS